MTTRSPRQKLGRRSGPPPKPTALKLVEGQRMRADRTRPAEPEFPDMAIEPPIELDEVARKEWDRVVPMLQASRVAKETDAAQLAVYCQSFSHWQSAEKVFGEMKARDPVTGGLLIRKSNGDLVANPAANLLTKAREACLRAATEFGLTPASRARVASEGEVGAGNKFGRNGRGA